MDHTKRGTQTYVFIDSQNLNLGVKNTLKGKDFRDKKVSIANRPTC